MRILKIVLILLLASAAALALAWQFSEPEPLPASSEAASLLGYGPWSVGGAEYELIDTTRPTDTNGDFAGAPGRSLTVRAWFPREEGAEGVAKGSFPLLLWSHGFFGSKDEPTYLARYLASHGWIVIAADYPLTSMGAPGGPNVFDVINQPGDLSFLIDTVLEWNTNPDGHFAGRIDPSRIAIAGLSLGGMTTELAAYHPRLRDARVRAAISVAGPLQFFGRRFFEDSQLPFMMIAGDIDAMVAYTQNARPVLDRVNNAWLVSIAGASHTGFADQASWLRWMDNADSIGCYVIKGKTPDAERDVGFYDRIGTEQEGVLRTMDDRLCRMDPLPDSISPLAQHRVVMLAVRSFLESELNPDAAQRERFRSFLGTRLAGEIPGVTVERSAP